MIRLKHNKLTSILLCAALALPLGQLTNGAEATAPSLQDVGAADGKTAVLTPQGTWIVPPPGSPLTLVSDTADATTIADGTPWGVEEITPESGSGESLSVASCTPHRAGWYATDNYDLWGGHAGIIPQNLPVATTEYCAGTGMGYTAGVSFGGPNWIQAGIVTFPGEVTAKWMCQANDNGALTTKYGPANAYGNGATVYTWFARDSSGIWRTYRYDTGPYAVELGCTLSRGSTNGEPLQAFGEIQGATSTNTPMGPWTMFDLRYLGTDNVWRVPTQLNAHYRSGTPCPPYGAGTISGGAFVAGSGQACSTGAWAYPN